MWLFTRYGFFSVVQARRVENGKVVVEPDPETLMVRARRREHLDALLERFDSLADLEITESPGTDYRYRMIVPRSVWRMIVDGLVSDIDYTNFKSACGKTKPDDRDYVSALHDVWQVCYGMQSSD